MMLSLQHLYPSWLSSSEVGASLSFLGLFRVSGVEILACGVSPQPASN